MKYWCLVLGNYKEKDDVIYFDSFETAKANFLSLAKRHENFNEFEMEANEENKVFACTWFDSSYNEFSTYASLHEREMPCVYSGLIF